MTERPSQEPGSDPAQPQPPGEKPKARIVLPKVPHRDDHDNRPHGPGGAARSDGRHSQIARGKPPRLPGRNG